MMIVLVKYLYDKCHINNCIALFIKHMIYEAINELALTLYKSHCGRGRIFIDSY